MAVKQMAFAKRFDQDDIVVPASGGQQPLERVQAANWHDAPIARFDESRKTTMVDWFDAGEIADTDFLHFARRQMLKCISELRAGNGIIARESEQGARWRAARKEFKPEHMDIQATQGHLSQRDVIQDKIKITFMCLKSSR
jgi:hypothetical protein